MRIAMLTNNYKPFVGGVPISIERLSDGLRELGHEVYIFAPTYNNQEESDPYVIRYGAFNKKLDNGVVVPYPFDITIEKAFKALDFDIIHVHHPNFIGWTAQYLGKKFNIPVAYTYHTRFEQCLHYVKFFKYLETLSHKHTHPLCGISSLSLNFFKNKFVPSAIKHYANHCDGVFAPTHMMQDLLEASGITAPIGVLPTGINDQFFKSDKKIINTIKAQYQKNKKYLFCTVSRLDTEKNIEFLVEGMYHLKNKFNDDFNLMIIGDGPLKETLQQKISQLNLDNEVTLVDRIANHLIHNYYAASDVFLFASKAETQGIVLLEAMASRTPVVAIEASGVVEVVRNGLNGYMTEDNVETWTDALIKVLEDQDHLHALSMGAHTTASNYTTTNIAYSAQKYYQQIITAHTYKKLKATNTKSHHLEGGISHEF